MSKLDDAILVKNWE